VPSRRNAGGEVGTALWKVVTDVFDRRSNERIVCLQPEWYHCFTSPQYHNTYLALLLTNVLKSDATSCFLIASLIMIFLWLVLAPIIYTVIHATYAIASAYYRKR
jgi:hypothetical protein